MTIGQWAVAFWLAALMTGVSGLAIYAALFTAPTDTTPWQGRLVYRTGQGLLALAVLLLAGGAFGFAAASAVQLVRGW